MIAGITSPSRGDNVYTLFKPLISSSDSGTYSFFKTSTSRAQSQFGLDTFSITEHSDGSSVSSHSLFQQQLIILCDTLYIYSIVSGIPVGKKNDLPILGKKTSIDYSFLHNYMTRIFDK